jgi:hypothetical protein
VREVSQGIGIQSQGYVFPDTDPRPHTSTLAVRAFSWMNSRRGSTNSPMTPHMRRGRGTQGSS